MFIISSWWPKLKSKTEKKKENVERGGRYKGWNCKEGGGGGYISGDKLERFFNCWKQIGTFDI